MSATNYTALIARLRLTADDPPTGQLAAMEAPLGRRDGANALFKLQNLNIITGTVGGVAVGPWYTYGTSIVRSTSGFTLSDAANGYVTITVAPDANVTNPFFFDYRFLWFVDADYQTMIDESTEELGTAAGTDVGEDLWPALIQLVLWRYWTRRASQWAIRYGASGGGASDSVKTVCDQFRALAKDARKNATDLIKFKMQGQGRRDRPASSTITLGISPYTPPR